MRIRNLLVAGGVAAAVATTGCSSPAPQATQPSASPTAHASASASVTPSASPSVSPSAKPSPSQVYRTVAAKLLEGKAPAKEPVFKAGTDPAAYGVQLLLHFDALLKASGTQPPAIPYAVLTPGAPVLCGMADKPGASGLYYIEDGALSGEHDVDAGISWCERAGALLVMPTQIAAIHDAWFVNAAGAAYAQAVMAAAHSNMQATASLSNLSACYRGLLWGERVSAGDLTFEAARTSLVANLDGDAVKQAAMAFAGQGGCA